MEVTFSGRDQEGMGHVAGDCGIANAILARIGDKWTMLIVMLLEPGKLRFNEIKRRVGGISQRMLTVTLRGLERDGLVLRTVTPCTPPRVDYELTRIIHRTARNRPRPPNTWARDFIAKNFIKQPIRIVVNDINGLALIAHFS